MQTAAELRAEARHARALSQNVFDAKLKQALLDAADDFEQQAERIEQDGNPAIRIGPKPEG